MNALDVQKIRKAMRAKHMSVTDLARETGVSRQMLHRLLQPDYRPLAQSVVAIAGVLGLEPGDMLDQGDRGGLQTAFSDLLRKARDGNPRAFELLPAHMARDPNAGQRLGEDADATTHLLLAAAAAVADALHPRRDLVRAVSLHARHAGSGQAFFFRSKFMTPERAIEQTPDPMRRHNVFGAFDMEGFRRHLP